MKITKHDREVFVKAVMNDVPEINYREMAKALIIEEVLKDMPTKIRAIYDDKKLMGYLEAPYIHMTWPLGSCAVAGATGFNFDAADKNLTAKIAEFAELEKEQNKARYELKHRVEIMIAGCSTLKKATACLPEFVNYLPLDRDGTGVNNLPAISNVVAELVQAG